MMGTAHLARTLARTKKTWLGSLSATFLVAMIVPRAVIAEPPIGRTAHRATRNSQPIAMAVGAVSAERAVRDFLQGAMNDAIGRNPRLKLSEQGSPGVAWVVNAHVRTLTVRRDGDGVTARCELGVVVADGNGAVRAMMDSSRIVRGGLEETDDVIARSALRLAAEGAVRSIANEVVH